METLEWWDVNFNSMKSEKLFENIDEDIFLMLTEQSPDEGGDFLSFSAPSDGSDSCESDSTIELDDKEEKEKIQKYFSFKFELRKNNINLFQPDRCTEDYLPVVLQNSKLIKDAPPEPYASRCLVEQHNFERDRFVVNAVHSAVKCLYENIPYVMPSDSNEEIRKKIDLKSPPFCYLDDDDFGDAVELYNYLLSYTEEFFHPLIRKAFKNKFFSLVDIEEKLDHRNLVKPKLREFCSPLEKRVFDELSRAKGLRDKNYKYNCNQIKLQREFDCYLCKCQKIKHDSRIDELIDDETVVPNQFNDLDPALIRLSLKTSIEDHWWSERVNQCYTYLQLLDAKHGTEETSGLDRMLIEFHTTFPCILDFPLDKPFDTAVEVRFKHIINKMKEMWFHNIEDYFVIEATLVYMKSILFEGVYQQTWPIAFPMMWYFNIVQEHSLYERDAHIVHEHPIYDHVFNVDFILA